MTKNDMSSKIWRTITKPDTLEYPASSEPYISMVRTDLPVLKQLYINSEIIFNLFTSVEEEKLEYRYEKNKWTLKEVLVHLVDDERIYAYRALRFARNDSRQLSSFDQNHFTHYAAAKERPLNNILDEYSAGRQSTLAMFEGFSEEALTRVGSTDEWRGSVRALLYHVTGHELNHLKIINEKYLVR
jgi:uncharacterized damage-inducible protein DinB